MGTSHFTQTGHTVNPVVYRVSKTLHLAKNELHFFSPGTFTPTETHW